MNYIVRHVYLEQEKKQTFPGGQEPEHHQNISFAQ